MNLRRTNETTSRGTSCLPFSKRYLTLVIGIPEIAVSPLSISVMEYFGLSPSKFHLPYLKKQEKILSDY